MGPAERTPATNLLISVLKGGWSAAEGQTGETEGGGTSAVERERTMRNLVDVQRKVERRHRRDRERQMLRVRGESVMFRSFPLTAQPHVQVQERLTIVQSRKAEEDLLGRRRADGLTRATQNLPQVTRFTRTPEDDGVWTCPLKHLFQEDKYQQQSAVRERVERLRRERSCVVQSKRDR